MLRAVAVYDLSEEKLTRSTVVQKDKDLFASNELENLENFTFKKLPKNMGSNIYYFYTQDEHHYLKKVSKLNKFQKETTPFMLAIYSRKKLEPEEIRNLFSNIQYSFTQQDEKLFKAMLEDMLINPCGYTSKDVLKRIEATLGETKSIMLKNIELVIEREVDLEQLKAKTFKLDDDAENFRVRAGKLNSCCRYY